MSSAELTVLAEAEHFWITTVWPVGRALSDGTFDISEIQEAWDENLDMIYQRYGRGPTIKPVGGFDGIPEDDITKILFACCEEEIRERFLLFFSRKVVVPYVIPVMDNLMRRYQQMVQWNSGDSALMFLYLVVISFMHETDHLALGKLAKKGKYGTTEASVILENEAYTWARTCENTLRVLIETYQKRVSLESFQMYSVWIQCKSPEHPLWRAYIHNMYSDMVKRRM